MPTTSHRPGQRILAILLLFWSLYVSLVFLSNTADALRALNWLPANWIFVSGNYALVRQVISIYSTSVWLSGLFYGGVLIWQSVGSILLWRAFAATLRQTPNRQAATERALTVLIGLWAAFIVADEFFLAYELPGLSSTHFSLLLTSLATLIAFRIKS
ncbi:hypothetical protein ACO2Q8_27010 [Larkinella sp. VNQ87]|uniref:hypothetical protein n=1 Tax=Larkinella sp. VNQ87 TaxID=3400921 RepID=UPI003C11F1F3